MAAPSPPPSSPPPSLLRHALALLRVSGANADEFLLLAALALPVIFTNLLGFSQTIIGQVLVGHVSAEALASATLANMLCNALGMSIIIGCSSACDTLASQAFGARNLARVGHVSQRGVAVGLALCLPVSIAFLFAADMLAALQQDPRVVADAGAYIRVLIFAMPALVTFEVLKKHLTNIGAPGVPLALTALGTAANLGAGVGLVFYTPLGFLGAPCALVVGAWVMVFSALSYFRFHRALHAAMRAHGLGSLVPGSTLAESAAAAEAAAAAAVAATATPPSALVAAPHAADFSSEGQTRSLVASASTVGVADVGDVLDKAHAIAAAAALAAPSAVAVAAPAAPAASSAAAVDDWAVDSVAAVDVKESAEKGLPPLPTDIDDVLDATLSEFSFAIAFSGWSEYLALGMPSAAMLFFEWASYEVTAVIAGLMSINALATHSILATTASLAFMPILGIGVATMIRIGNRLGERRPEEAKRTFRVAMVVWLVYAALNAAFLLSVSSVWGRVFTDDAGVDAHVTRIIGVLALYGVFDLGQCILCFVFRGLGRPGMAAIANGTGYVCVGLPLAYVFGITLNGSVLGMWLGYAVAVTFVFVLLSLLLRCMDFAKESEVAFARATAPDAHKRAVAAAH